MVNPCQEVKLMIENANSKFIVDNYSRIYNLCQEESINIPCIIPIKNLSKGQISSGYGTRVHPIFKTIKHHGGIDIACSDTIIVSANGIVEKVQYSTSLGKYVIVNHLNGYKTKYGHLNKILTFEGENLKIGDNIGIAGSTGSSTGNHLHYIVEKNNKEINPTDNLLLFYKNALSRRN